MPNIPEGVYPCPSGLLLIKATSQYSAIVRWMPTDREIPAEVESIDFYWNGEEFDGTSIGFGIEGIPQEQAETLIQKYYQGVG